MNTEKRWLSFVLAVILCVSVLSVCASAATEIKSGIGIVTTNALRLRSGPNMSSSTLTTAYDGDYVVVLEKSGDWYKVIYNLKTGYMHGDYLKVVDRENVELGYGTINAYAVNLRSKPNTSSSVVTVAHEGSKAYIIGFNCGWYKVLYENQIAYVRSDLLDLTEIPYENRGSTNTPKYFKDGKAIASIPTVNSKAQTIITTAKKYLGTPYVWGGSSPSGFDCSGFVQYVLRSCGYTVGRVCSEQYKAGVSVSKSNLQPGDLVFFQNTYTSGISHVGIYIGDGQFIHSSGSVKISDLTSGYYDDHWLGARRIV